MEAKKRRVPKKKLILQNPQDIEGSKQDGVSDARLQSTYQYFFSKVPLRAAECVPLFFIILLPLTVQAGVLTTVFSGDIIEYQRTVDTSKDKPSEVSLLAAHNTADQKLAQGGGDIIVDGDSFVSGGLYSADLIEEKNPAGEIALYAVREGDTLSQIAEMFDVNSNTILWANDLKSAADIHPGDTLVILPIVGVRHVVKSGDTVASIAKKYDGNVDEILQYNQLASSDDIETGDTLVVPGGNLHKETAPASSGSKSTTGKSATNVAVAAGGGFIHPVPGAVRTQGIHGYNAVDLAAPAGTPIRAAAAGEVIVSKASGWNGGYGNYIVVRHGNGAQTLYSHMSANYVGVGAVVAAGTTIGAVGNTGRSTGDHLHFEVRGARNPF